MSSPIVLYLFAQGAPTLNYIGPGVTELDASTASKLDAIYAQYMPLGNVTFMYGPGLFQTTGYFFQQRRTVYSGNAHIGSGMFQTTIQLVGSSTPTNDGLIFAVQPSDGLSGSINGWSISDLTLDCNAANQLKFTGGLGAIGAIGLPGSQNVTIQRVRFINFGTGKVLSECFPCYSFASTGQGSFTMQNILIDSCIFTQPVTGNKDGVSCCAINDLNSAGINADNTCVISNCQFLDVASDFSYSHAYGAPTCVRNYTRNCGVAFYLEPLITQYSGITILLRGNTALNVQRGCYVLMHSSASILNLVASGEFYTLQNTNTAGFQVTGNSLASPICTANKIILENNTLVAGGSTVKGFVFNENGTNDMTVQELTIENNVMLQFGASNYTSIDGVAVIIASNIANNTQL